MPAQIPVSPDLQRLLDWIDAQDRPAQERLTNEQMQSSTALWNAVQGPRQHGYGYGARTQTREVLPLPGDVLGW